MLYYIKDVTHFGSALKDQYGDFQIEIFWEQGNSLFRV